MVHSSLRKHSIVLDLGLAQRRAVVGDEDELGCEQQASQNEELVSWKALKSHAAEMAAAAQQRQQSTEHVEVPA